MSYIKPIMIKELALETFYWKNMGKLLLRHYLDELHQ